MKKTVYLILITLISLALTSCMMFNDTQPPEFYEKPTIEGSTRGTTFSDAGDEIIINFKVRDNQAINYIQLYKSTDLSKPIQTILNNFQKNKFEANGLRVNLPYDIQKYKLYLVAADIEGNKVTQQIGENHYFDVKDSNSPILEERFEVEKITDELYKMKFFFEEIGSGIENFTVNYKNKNVITKKYNSADDFEDITDNYYVIEESNSWKQSGYLVFFSNLSIGNNNFNVFAKDKYGNTSDSYLFTETIESENPDSQITLDINYQEFYIMDERTNETEEINFKISASDEDSYISKLEIIENGRKKEVPVNPAVPSYNYEYTIGRKSSIQNINLKVIAYNTSDNQVEKDFTISVIEEKKPNISLILEEIEKSAGFVPPKDFIIGDNVFIENGDSLHFSLKAEDLLGLDNIVIYTIKDFNKEIIYTRDFVENPNLYEEDIKITFDSKGVYKIYVSAVNKNDLSTTYQYDKNIVYSDENYTVGNIKLRANFYYNGNEIDQDIFYKSVGGEKTFTVSDKTNIEIASEIISKYQNIKAVYYQLDATELPAENYDSNSLEWRSIDYYEVDINESTKYQLSIKIVDTFGKEYLLSDNYYVKVLNTPEEAYGSEINIFADNYNPGTGDEINISYSIDDDFGVDNYKVELYEITEDASILIDGNPYINKKLDERKTYDNSKNWTPYRTSIYKFKLTVENILGVVKEYETKEIVVSELYINIIEPLQTQITKRRSDSLVPFKVDTSGGATLNVYVENLEGNKYQIMNRYIENNENIFTRYDFTLNLGMEYPDYSSGNGIVFDKPGEYRLFFQAKYSDKIKEIQKTLLIRDDTDTILESFEITPDFTGSSTPTDSEFASLEKGVYEEYEFSNNKYYIPVDYDGANKTRVDIEIKLIDYNVLDDVIVEINGNSFTFEAPTNIENITSGANEGKKIFTYQIGLAKENINVGINNIVFWVEKEIYDEPKNILELDLVALEWESPNINDYDFDISNVNISKGQTSNKYFVLGQHRVNFNEVDFSDNFGIGAFDLRLFERDGNNNFIDLDKSLYGVMRIRNDQTQSKQTNVSESDLETVFGSNGLNLSNFSFNESIGYYRLEATLYDETYVIAMESEKDAVKNYIEKYNKKTAPIYIYLTENVKAKKITLLPGDIDYIREKTFNYDLEIELSESLDVEEVVDIDSIDAKLIGPKEIHLDTTASYAGENVYKIKSIIAQSESVYDGLYSLVINFKTKYSDKLEEIKKSVIINLDQSRSLGRIQRKYINGKGNTSFEIEITTLYPENLIYDVENYYFEYNGIIKQGVLNPNKKTASVDFYDVPNGTYELQFHLIDKMGEELISTPIEFVVEENPPIIENIITDTKDRNRNVLALNTDEKFTDKNIAINDDVNLYKSIFTSNNDFISINDRSREHIVNIASMLSNVGDTNSYTNGASFSLNLDITDINSNDTYENITVYRDITAPSTVIDNGIPNLIVEDDKNIELLVNDNVATKIAELSILNTTILERTMDQAGNDFDIHDFEYEIPNLPAIEGEFTLEVFAEDLAGNSTTMQLPDKIRIDNQKPSIEDFNVTDNANLNGGKYYINDTNKHLLEWQVSDFTIDDSQGKLSFYVNGTSTFEATNTNRNSGFLNLNSLGINSENEYEIYMIATDEAGLTDESNSYKIVYDKTVPNIISASADSTPISAGNSYSLGEEFVNIEVQFEDINFGTYNVTYQGNNQNATVDFNQQTGIGILRIQNLEIFNTPYNLVIEILDYAGNTTGTVTYTLKK